MQYFFEQRAWAALQGEEDTKTSLCPAYTPSRSSRSLEQHSCLDTKAQQQSMAGGTQWTAWSKNFSSMPRLLGPLELAAAEPSAQNPFPSRERTLRTQSLAFCRYLVYDGDPGSTTEYWTSTDYKGITGGLQSFMQSKKPYLKWLCAAWSYRRRHQLWQARTRWDHCLHLCLLYCLVCITNTFG